MNLLNEPKYIITVIDVDGNSHTYENYFDSFSSALTLAAEPTKQGLQCRVFGGDLEKVIVMKPRLG